MEPRCRFCQEVFTPSEYHTDQTVCSQPVCQARRRRAYHHQKIQTDSDYHKTCLNSQKNWRENHPGYQKEYRNHHPELLEQNRQKQQKRDRLRHLKRVHQLPPKDLSMTRCQGPLWLIGSTPWTDLDKNTLAFSQFYVFQLTKQRPFSGILDKNTLAFAQPAHLSNLNYSIPLLPPS